MSIENDDVGPGWDGVQPPAKGGGKRQSDNLSLFMRMEPREEPYHIRLACTPIKFRKHRWAFRSLKQYPISPATDQSEKDLDIAWKEGKFMPVTRYASFVFDRDNNNRLRILEECPDIYGPIGNDAHVTKTNPASATKGWDWIILVTEEVVDGRKTRKHQVVIDRNKGATPFTAEEIKALENPNFQREALETKYFAKSTPEEIKDLWEQLPASARMNESREGNGKGKQETKQASAERSAQAPTAKPAAAPATTTKSAASAPAAVAKPAEAPVEPKDDVRPDEAPADSGDAEEESARMF